MAAGAGEVRRTRARTTMLVGFGLIGAAALWGTLLAIEGSGQTSGLQEQLSTTAAPRTPEPAALASQPVPDDLFPNTCALRDCRGADLEGDVSRLIYIKDVCLAEGTGGTRMIEFLVQRSAPFTNPASAHFATSAASATVGSDFAARSGTVSFGPGQDRKTVAVRIVSDSVDESNEAFRVVLSQASGANLADRSGVGTIIDDDGGASRGCPDRSPTLQVQDACTVEGDAGTTLMKFRVVRSGDLSGQSRMNWGSFNGSAVNPADYIAKYGSHIFQTGQTVQSALIEIPGNTAPESTKRFTFRLFNVEDGRATREGTGTIVDDDGGSPGACGAGARLSIGSARITEGDRGSTWLRMNVALSGQHSQPVTVKFKTVPGTASASDFVQRTGTLTFQPGQTTGFVRIKVVGDSKPERVEQFTVVLSNPARATISRASGTGTIVDDD